MLGPPAVLAAAARHEKLLRGPGNAATEPRSGRALSDAEMLEVESVAGDAAVVQLLLTHKSADLARHARVYAALLAQVRMRGPLLSRSM